MSVKKEDLLEAKSPHVSGVEAKSPGTVLEELHRILKNEFGLENDAGIDDLDLARSRALAHRLVCLIRTSHWLITAESSNLISVMSTRDLPTGVREAGLESVPSFHAIPMGSGSNQGGSSASMGIHPARTTSLLSSRSLLVPGESPLLPRSPVAQQRVGTVYTMEEHKAGASHSMDGSLTAVVPVVVDTEDIEKSKDNYNRKKINEYTILQELGRGAYGKVKLAVKDGKQYAIKVVKKPMPNKKMELKSYKRIQAEVAVMKKVGHPNLVKLYEVMNDMANAKVYLVMEYVPGKIVKMTSPTTCIPIAPSQVQHYARQIADAVSVLHRAGVFHRDIKPDNILLGENGRVCVADFGVSAICGKEGVEGVEGTPAFMAPEICRGDRLVSGDKVDVWAVGVTLFLMMYGFLPFQGDTPISMSRSIINDPLVIPHRDHVPVEFVDIIEQLLAKSPEDRMSMKAFRKCKWLSEETSFELDSCPPPDEGEETRAGTPNLSGTGDNGNASSPYAIPDLSEREIEDAILEKVTTEGVSPTTSPQCPQLTLRLASPTKLPVGQDEFAKLSETKSKQP